VHVSEFHFDLPADLIAQRPPAVRGDSRMLVLHGSRAGQPSLRDAAFADLPGMLGAGDLLVLNDSRVLPGRLFATRAGARTQAGSPRPSGSIEVLLTERVDAAVGENLWRALVRPGRKVQVGERLGFIGGDGATLLSAEVVGAGEYGERALRFEPVADFYEVLGRIGHMPLPPYIRRDQAVQADSAEDRSRYQTVYAAPTGSAAAPTAGLHFTPEVLEALRGRGVEIAYLTLHVGLGTFQPIRVKRLEEIRLHAERYTLSAATAEAVNRARKDGRRIVAVGTTTTRTLEHVALEAERAGRDGLEAHSGETSIFLAPGHRFRLVSGLLTNFHLPESTLLMLVSAFAAPVEEVDLGRRTVLAAYAHAVERGYRFYSYGDCMLVV
jgi:S-adenosylmethionine:tRNA ribosyltransferase-isomerase